MDATMDATVEARPGDVGCNTAASPHLMRPPYASPTGQDRAHSHTPPPPPAHTTPAMQSWSCRCQAHGTVPADANRILSPWLLRQPWSASDRSRYWECYCRY